MLRGAIDFADPQRVAGWIYSDVVDVRGRTVLAFLDKDCVGAGTIDVFRQDLADAGLGDGMVGFNLRINVQAWDVGRVTVRFEGSDFSLLQAQSRVAVAGRKTEGPGEFALYAPDDVDWLHEKGWLDQDDFDFMHLLTSVGICARSLRTRGGVRDAETEAQRLFELFERHPVPVTVEEVLLADLAKRRLTLLMTLSGPIIALKGSEGSIAVLEGSNRDADFLKKSDLIGAVQHRLEPNDILFLDIRSQFEGRGSGNATVYLPD